MNQAPHAGFAVYGTPVTYNFTEAFPMLDLHRQEAVIAFMNALHNEPTLSPVTQKSVMINAITRVNEVMA